MRIPSTFHVAVLATSFLAAATVPEPAAAASCPAISLWALSPSSGSPGDLVHLFGDGYCAAGEAFFAWGTDGARGFAFSIDTAVQNELVARLGPVHVPVAGPVRLWLGRRISLPDTVLELADGIYHIRSRSILLPTETTSGPQFSAQAGNVPGFTSKLVNGELRIDLGTAASAPSSSGLHGGLSNETGRQVKGDSENTISVIVVVRTDGSPGGGDGGGPPEEDPQVSAPNGWVVIFDLDCFGPASACDGDLATSLSRAFDETLSSLGMASRVEGSTVVLGHQTNNINAGLVTVTPE
jgi:hypothetical protein